MNTLKYKSPYGIITIGEKNNAITKIYLPNAEPNTAESPSGLLEKAKIQFDEYFAGKRKIFDLPIDFDHCTDFMKSVYRELLKIPYGKTASYKEIAEKIGCPKGYRAVGQANNKNPIAIIVPCHRVIGFSGNPTGYAGGVNLKIKLLELEKTFTAIV